MTDPDALLAIVRRQRDLEWTQAHEVLRERSHELRNLIQIVELASVQLEARVDGDAADIVGELARTAAEMKRAFEARPGAGAPIAEAVRAAVELVRPATGELAVTQRLDAATTTALLPHEVEQLVIGLVLDAGRHAAAIDLLVRERPIEGVRWVELVCGIDTAPGELRVIKAIVERAGGEVTASERRGGGTEIAVAIPAVGPTG